jgi:hypothetical protein
MIERITFLEFYLEVVFCFYVLLIPVLLHFREESKKEKAAKPKPVDDTILFDCGDLSQPIKTKLSWK